MSAKDKELDFLTSISRSRYSIAIPLYNGYLPTAACWAMKLQRSWQRNDPRGKSRTKLVVMQTTTHLLWDCQAIWNPGDRSGQTRYVCLYDHVQDLLCTATFVQWMRQGRLVCISKGVNKKKENSWNEYITDKYTYNSLRTRTLRTVQCALEMLLYQCHGIDLNVQWKTGVRVSVRAPHLTVEPTSLRSCKIEKSKQMSCPKSMAADIFAGFMTKHRSWGQAGYVEFFSVVNVWWWKVAERVLEMSLETLDLQNIQLRVSLSLSHFCSLVLFGQHSLGNYLCSGYDMV